MSDNNWLIKVHEKREEANLMKKYTKANCMMKESGQTYELTEGQTHDLEALRQQGYIYVSKINDYVVCFAETATSYRGDVILDGDTNNKSWLSTAKWLEPGRLHKIDDVLL